METDILKEIDGLLLKDKEQAIKKVLDHGYKNLGGLLCSVYKEYSYLLDTIEKKEETLQEKENDVIIVVDNIQEDDSAKITRVKIEGNWNTSEKICKEWEKYLNKHGKDFQIKIVDRYPYDYKLIINFPYSEINKRDTNVVDDVLVSEIVKDDVKIILFNSSNFVLEYTKRNVEEFNNSSEKLSQTIKKWYGDFTSTKNKKIITTDDGYMLLIWSLSYTYEQLLTSTFSFKKDKNKTISCLSNFKYDESGLVKQIDFIKFLESKAMNLDIYETRKYWETNKDENRYLFKSYKGLLKENDSDKAYIPYKYVLCIENVFERDHITEILSNGILSECLVFYCGCLNVKQYFNDQAIVYINLHDFEKDYNIIQTVINNDEYSKRLPYIREAKKQILETYSLESLLRRVKY